MSKDATRLDRIGTYFQEVEPSGGKPARYVPRSVQLDLEGGVLQRVSSRSTPHDEGLILALSVEKRPQWQALPARFVDPCRKWSCQQLGQRT